MQQSLFVMSSSPDCMQNSVTRHCLAHSTPYHKVHTVRNHSRSRILGYRICRRSPLCPETLSLQGSSCILKPLFLRRSGLLGTHCKPQTPAHDYACMCVSCIFLVTLKCLQVHLWKCTCSLIFMCILAVQKRASDNHKYSILDEDSPLQL